MRTTHTSSQLQTQQHQNHAVASAEDRLQRLHAWIKNAGVEVQKHMPTHVHKITQARDLAQTLQSWPMGLGSPTAQDHKKSVALFAGRWHYCNHEGERQTLQQAEQARAELAKRICDVCQDKGISAVMVHHRDADVMIPAA